MSDEKPHMENTIQSLNKQCEEIGAQVHLAAAEVKVEYEVTKKKLEKMSDDYDPLKTAVKKSGGNLLSSLQRMGEEVRASLDQIGKSLK